MANINKIIILYLDLITEMKTLILNITIIKYIYLNYYLNL